ncbi:MAG: transglycosylase domain-containing protein [Gammaproteobacteria bacterium]|jgi:penicillin-binding protein 1C|nr:transglycosylase domain-containing protein [Gammaproteobacteria bacterium]MBU0771305.1 transglycosylase domain-containing protein [Gammaproteobacteria bacterium]MBU0858086.1 transglycosylase domain-containing protein [Gammaproteobacteria bacterium]MBU1847129.1 transglycosylase domain-containing protein [Gammaproteobacteria bacterium]
MNVRPAPRLARCLLLCGALLSGGAALANAPDFETVRDNWQSSEARLLDRYGQPLAEVRVDFTERRLDWVSARALSPPLVRALLVAEDKRFLEHSGVDWQALAGATWDNLWRTLEGRRPRGASTLTMQLAGLIDPALRLMGTRRSVGQKWDQAAAARAIERRWNKAQILEAYFNLAPFRGELRGISAAARGLFGKDPDSVEAPEAVLLAALLRGPNASPERVARRACAVAKRMKPVPACADIRALAEQVLSHRYRLEPRWDDATGLARRLLREPGELRVTTLDARMQRKALAALGQDRTDTAVVVLDNATGEVLVWGGGSAEADAVPRRFAAGSALQPFIYGLAIEQRWLTGASVLDDSPAFLALPPPAGVPDDAGLGAVSVRRALAGAAQFAVLRARAMVGEDALGARLRELGLGAQAGGGARVSLIELANAYRSLVNDGVWARWGLEASAFQQGERAARRVWPANVAWLTCDLLSDRVPQEASGTAAGPYAWSALMNAHAPDRRTWWAVGFSARYTVAVRAPRPAGDAWQAVLSTLDVSPLPPPVPPAALKAARVQFEPPIEAEREEFFLPGTQQAFVDATVRDVFGRPRIVQPGAGVVRLVSASVPAGRQPLLLEARPPWPGLSWLVDGETLPAIEGRALWSPRPGRHRLALVDASGLQLQSLEFEIRLGDVPVATAGGGGREALRGAHAD